MAAAAALLGLQRLRRPEYWSLAGRVVLVTGGSRGLGLALARRLVAEDARVTVCARDRETLERARDDLERLGGSVLAIPCDVTDRDAVTRMVQEVTDRLGKIDALINNAGTIAVGPIETMDVEDFSRAMNVNFWGPLYATLAVLPAMRRQRSGRIVNVASIGGKISVPHLVPYSASKFALVGLSEGLRAELRHHGIEVSTVCPGLMRTGSPRHAWFKGQHRKEYAWFSVSDSLPGLSMDADRAASEIVEALKRGCAERVLSLPARIGVKTQAMFPGLTAETLALADRLLPGPAFLSARRAVKGESSTSEWLPSWLARLGARAERRYNQVPPVGTDA
jgi:NAD(P)-dependent dehydrogenase (short-subunit alcohol dehydrogenase family)